MALLYTFRYSFGMRTIIPAAGNPALREKAVIIPPADITGEHIQHLIADMRSLLAKEKNGVALAAPQVGEAVQLFIVSARALQHEDENDEDHAPIRNQVPLGPDLVYINPEIIKVSRLKRKKHEGCLSIRGKWGIVPRAEKMTVRAYDEHGQQFTRGASGFLAHIFQHELDHLDGILYIDKATDIHDDEASA